VIFTGDFAPDSAFAAGMAFSAGLALVINFVLQIDSLLGRGVLAAFVVGRYHRPREEERVFLFLDIVGSTALAERLGGPRFLALLDRIYHDIAEPIMAHRGDIHKYVGDEAIVTWRPKDAFPRANCVRCIFAIRARLAERAADYGATFGAQPRFRFGLHGGTVVSGELGDLKREIAFLGDAMNTTARLIDACREHGEDCIASGEVIRRLDLPPGVTARPLGAIALRGKAEPLPLFALSTLS
jgi:adenylate cyclase